MRNKTVLMIAILITIVLAGLWLKVTVWRECRADGRSVWYCLRMIG